MTVSPGIAGSGIGLAEQQVPDRQARAGWRTRQQEQEQEQELAPPAPGGSSSTASSAGATSAGGAASGGGGGSRVDAGGRGHQLLPSARRDDGRRGGRVTRREAELGRRVLGIDRERLAVPVGGGGRCRPSTRSTRPRPTRGLEGQRRRPRWPASRVSAVAWSPVGEGGHRRRPLRRSVSPVFVYAVSSAVYGSGQPTGTRATARLSGSIALLGLVGRQVGGRRARRACPRPCAGSRAPSSSGSIASCGPLLRQGDRCRGRSRPAASDRVHVRPSRRSAAISTTFS